MTVDTRELQLYQSSDGCVWFGDGSKPDRIENSTPEQIAELDWVREVERIRLIGLPTHAELITALARPRFEEGLYRPSRLELMSPGLIPKGYRDDPALVLSQMRRTTVNPSVGGWHDVNRGDYITYQLITEFDHGELTPRVRSLLTQHPAWPAFAFIPNLDLESAWYLITRIVDPRWWIDPMKPDRRSNLYSYLGLFEPNAEKFISPKARIKPANGFDRFLMLTKCWTPSPQPEPEVLKTGKHFLWNCWASHSSQSRGLLRAGRMLVDFVCSVWLQSIAPVGRELFVPEYFFRTTQDATAYTRHRNRFPTYYR